MTIRRYDQNDNMGVPVMDEDDLGEWVRFDDVIHIIERIHSIIGQSCTYNDCGCEVITDYLRGEATTDLISRVKGEK